MADICVNCSGIIGKNVVFGKKLTMTGYMCPNCVDNDRKHKQVLREQKETRKLLEENNNIAQAKIQEDERHHREIEKRESLRDSHRERQEHQRFKSSIKDDIFSMEDLFDDEKYERVLKKFDRVFDKIKSSSYSFKDCMDYSLASLFFYMCCFSYFGLAEIEKCRLICFNSMDVLKESFDSENSEDENYYLKILYLYIKLFSSKYRDFDEINEDTCAPFKSITTNLLFSKMIATVLNANYEIDNDENELSTETRQLTIYKEDRAFIKKIGAQYLSYALDKFKESTNYQGAHSLFELILDLLATDYYNEFSEQRIHPINLMDSSISANILRFESRLSDTKLKLEHEENIKLKLSHKTKKLDKAHNIIIVLRSIIEWLIIYSPVSILIIRAYKLFVVGNPDVIGAIISLIVTGVLISIPVVILGIISEPIMKILIIGLVEDILEKKSSQSSSDLYKSKIKVNSLMEQCSRLNNDISGLKKSLKMVQEKIIVS